MSGGLRRTAWYLVDWVLDPFAVLRRVLPSVVALLALGGVSATVFKLYHPEFTWVDASYAAMATITTLGDYGTDMTRMSASEKVVLIGIVLASVAVAATALQEIVGALVLREVWREAQTKRRVRRMENHAIVMGSGTCAREVAKKLGRLGVACVLVVPDGTPDEKVEDVAPIPVLRGDLRSHEALKEAGIERAAQVQIVVDDDALALLVTMNARELSEAARIVVNVDDDELLPHFRRAGADSAIGSSLVLGRIMAVAGVAENVSGLVFSDQDQGLQKEIGVFRVAEGGSAAGKTLAASRIPEHAWVLGVVRAGRFNWETARDTSLAVDDEVIVLGDVTSFGRIRALVAGEPRRARGGPG